ncbi:MAG TPA: hypothetical protein H9867_00755 [Candidatus Corynebacterium gallistercoris]|uniref:Uncharacterized protein n=1 Tax=Candidatus Corynebacterium gallistercoris TaxID=2838530 RepID=A0A9D1UP45_9CORY|nr:hypothetical protein [Candidatus Corynebacterium gallistercoris]
MLVAVEWQGAVATKKKWVRALLTHFNEKCVKVSRNNAGQNAHALVPAVAEQTWRVPSFALIYYG